MLLFELQTYRLPLDRAVETGGREGGRASRVDPHQILAEIEAKPVSSKKNFRPHIFRSPTGPAQDA